MKKTKQCEPLVRYCEIEGITREELASRLGENAPTVRGWVNGHRSVSPEVAVKIERKIGIPRETLRPDIFVKRAA